MTTLADPIMREAGARRWAPGWRDVGLALVGLVVDVIGFSTVLSGSPGQSGLVLGYAAVGFAVLAWRAVAPLIVFVVMWAHSCIAELLLTGYGPTVGLLIGLFTVAARAGTRAGLAALAMAFVPSGLHVAAEVERAATVSAELVVSTLMSSIVLFALINGGVWSLGRWSRSQQERAALLEQQRDRAAREAVVHERIRIARDLHDVIAHTVSVMGLQAAGARRILRSRPERAEQALADVEDVGARAAVELRRLLVVLRDDDSTLATSFTQHGLADLDPLLDDVRSAGVPARLAVQGATRDLESDVDLAAYRVVQEALTNVIKHVGPGVPTTVGLTWTDDRLEVEIHNAAGVPTGRPAITVGSSGYGLAGLHERLAAVGGRLQAGPRPAGGYEVRATLPARSDGPSVIPTGGDHGIEEAGS